jgi:thiosulfate dehydrogenase
LLMVIVAACGRAPGASAGARVAADTLRLSAPADSTLHDDPMSRSIKRGLALVTATRDSLPSNVGGQLRCVSCHLDNGRRAFAMPWVGAYGRFPQYRSRSGQVARLEERINDCFQRSLNGRALPTEGADMRDIMSYIAWLSRGSVSGARARGTGIDSLAPLPVDTLHGRTVFVQHCARCHALDGQGMLGRGLVNAGPPLWGPGSFNIGAGMARLRVIAAFVHRQMPFDRPAMMSSQDAFDVAGYVVSRPRPDFVGKERDWPNGDAPADAAYLTTAKARRP